MLHETLRIIGYLFVAGIFTGVCFSINDYIKNKPGSVTRLPDFGPPEEKKQDWYEIGQDQWN